MKHLKIGRYELCALALVGLALLVRLVLASQNWPASNSDEGTMGIMALHIAYNGEHPVVFYGQSYMGAIEAYLGAAFFHLFGPSLFTLRLGVMLMAALFLIGMAILTSLLYSKKLALIVLALLSLGSAHVLTRQIIATGGSSQTLLFTTLAFILAYWLALSAAQPPTLRTSRLRLLAYGGFGLVAGLGLWSDMVSLPFFLMAALLIGIFCWRDLWSWAPLCILAGFLIGASPMLGYDITSGQSSLTILLNLVHGTATQAPHTPAQVLQGIRSTVQISLPMATGEPFCPVTEYASLGDSSLNTPQCILIRGVWGSGYLVLWTLAVLLTLRSLWRLRRKHGDPSQKTPGPYETRALLVRHLTRLGLLLAAAATITGFALSQAPLGTPGGHARYLVALLVATPAIIAPLWEGVSHLASSSAWRVKLKAALSGLVLLLVGACLLTGTMRALGEIPAAQAANAQQNRLISDLLRVGASHIYTDYWTCDRIAFESRERIICGVLNPGLLPSHNRDSQYYAIVSADPRSAYIFPLTSAQAGDMLQKAANANGSYRRLTLDGYVVYVPVS